MNAERKEGVSCLHDDVVCLLYEAAQAEDRFRGLQMSRDAINTVINRQLGHELMKLASRGIDTSGALRDEAVEVSYQLKIREA